MNANNILVPVSYRELKCCSDNDHNR